MTWPAAAVLPVSFSNTATQLLSEFGPSSSTRNVPAVRLSTRTPPPSTLLPGEQVTCCTISEFGASVGLVRTTWLRSQFESPAGPCAPMGPCGPAGPWAPVAPVAPVAPAGPVSPFGPCGPAGPIGPVAPVAPGAPVSPCGPCGPTGPAGPCGPAGPAGPCWFQVSADSFCLQSAAVPTMRVFLSPLSLTQAVIVPPLPLARTSATAPVASTPSARPAASQTSRPCPPRTKPEEGFAIAAFLPTPPRAACWCWHHDHATQCCKYGLEPWQGRQGTAGVATIRKSIEMQRRRRVAASPSSPSRRAATCAGRSFGATALQPARAVCSLFPRERT